MCPMNPSSNKLLPGERSFHGLRVVSFLFCVNRRLSADENWLFVVSFRFGVQPGHITLICRLMMCPIPQSGRGGWVVNRYWRLYRVLVYDEVNGTLTGWTEVRCSDVHDTPWCRSVQARSLIHGAFVKARLSGIRYVGKMVFFPS